MHQSTSSMRSLWLLASLLAIIPFVNRTELIMLGIWGALGLRLIERYRSNTPSAWRFPTAAIPLGLFALTGIIQAMVEGANSGTWPALALWATAVAVVLLGTDVVDSLQDAGIVLTGAAAGAALTGLHGIWQSLTGVANEASWTDAVQGDWNRVYSVFFNPNIFGTFLALILPALVLLLYLDRRWWRAAFIIPILGALALTYSRGAWVASALGLLIPLVYLSRRWLLALVAGALIAPFILPTQIWSRLASISLADSSIAYRLKIFTGTWNVIMANFFVGVGPGLVSFRQAYAQHQVPDTPAFHGHNLFLQVWAERGILGLMLLVAALLLIGAAVVRSKALHPERVLGLAALAGVAGALLQGMVDYIWSDFRVALLFWALTGVGLGLCRSDPAVTKANS